MECERIQSHIQADEWRCYYNCIDLCESCALVRQGALNDRSAHGFGVSALPIALGPQMNFIARNPELHSVTGEVTRDVSGPVSRVLP